MLLIIYVVIENIESLSKTFESIVDYTFTNIYFPSIYVYLVILIVMNVFCLLSLFKVRLEKKYKVVNGVSVLVINFILALILDVIARDNVDLFKKTSLFSNVDLVNSLQIDVPSVIELTYKVAKKYPQILNYEIKNVNDFVLAYKDVISL
mgnify:CR=1 FL=1